MCGANLDVIDPDLPVHSIDDWKKQKDEIKNETLLKSRQEAKEHMDQIKQRMYQQQANFNVDEMFEEVKKKDKKDKCGDEEE